MRRSVISQSKFESGRRRAARAWALLLSGPRCAQITNERLRLHEIDELTRCTEPQSGCCGCCRAYGGPPLGGACGNLCCGCGAVETRAWYWVYKRFVCGPFSPAHAKARSEKAMRRVEDKCERLEKAELRPTGLAIVVFNYEIHAKNMLRDHNRLPAFASTLFTYDFMRRFHQLTSTALPCLPAPFRTPPERRPRQLRTRERRVARVQGGYSRARRACQCRPAAARTRGASSPSSARRSRATCGAPRRTAEPRAQWRRHACCTSHWDSQVQKSSAGGVISRRLAG